MNRIKMRGWNNDLKRYFYAPSESWSIVFHSESIMAQMWSSDGLIDEIPVDCVEMSTGLKDKNGNDIYDGDIVNVDNRGRWDLDKVECEKVEFDRIGWYPWTEVSAQIDLDYTVSSNPDDIEILGNIHEHPHLLEDKR